MEGVVTKVVTTRGFGFIRGRKDNAIRFFHAKDVTPISDYDLLEEGVFVTFNPVGELDESEDATNNGLRADKVCLLSGNR